MESKPVKITEERIQEVCLEGFIDYIITNSESIWIRGVKTEIIDVRKYLLDGYMDPKVTHTSDIVNAVQELLIDGTTKIMFNSSCSLFKTSKINSKDSERVEVKSNQSEGSLLLLEDNSLKFEIKRIDFSIKN